MPYHSFPVQFRDCQTYALDRRQVRRGTDRLLILLDAFVDLYARLAHASPFFGKARAGELFQKERFEIQKMG